MDELLYMNEYKKDGVVFSKLILVHDDSFGRTLTESEIIEELDKCNIKYSMKVLSLDKYKKVNMLFLDVEGEYNEPNTNSNYPFENLDDVKYYTIIPCDYSPI